MEHQNPGAHPKTSGIHSDPTFSWIWKVKVVLHIVILLYSMTLRLTTTIFYVMMIHDSSPKTVIKLWMVMVLNYSYSIKHIMNIYY